MRNHKLEWRYAILVQSTSWIDWEQSITLQPIIKRVIQVISTTRKQRVIPCDVREAKRAYDLGNLRVRPKELIWCFAKSVLKMIDKAYWADPPLQQDRKRV